MDTLKNISGRNTLMASNVLKKSTLSSFLTAFKKGCHYFYELPCPWMINSYRNFPMPYTMNTIGNEIKELENYALRILWLLRRLSL